MTVSGLVAMSVVRGCVAILSLSLLCLVGETMSSVCCSLPAEVQVPCDRSTTLPTPSAEEDPHSAEVASDPATEPISSLDDQSDGAGGISDPEADQGEGTTHVCYEYYCGTVQVEAADTYCSYEQCDSAGCHCTADCIDGSYRAPKWTR